MVLNAIAFSMKMHVECEYMFITFSYTYTHIHMYKSKPHMSIWQNQFLLVTDKPTYAVEAQRKIIFRYKGNLRKFWENRNWRLLLSLSYWVGHTFWFVNVMCLSVDVEFVIIVVYDIGVNIVNNYCGDIIGI